MMVNTAGYENECDHLVDDYSEWSVKLGRRGLDGVTQTGKHRIFRTIGTRCTPSIGRPETCARGSMRANIKFLMPEVA